MGGFNSERQLEIFEALLTSSIEVIISKEPPNEELIALGGVTGPDVSQLLIALSNLFLK